MWPGAFYAHSLFQAPSNKREESKGWAHCWSSHTNVRMGFGKKHKLFCCWWNLSDWLNKALDVKWSRAEVLKALHISHKLSEMETLIKPKRYSREERLRQRLAMTREWQVLLQWVGKQKDEGSTEMTTISAHTLHHFVLLCDIKSRLRDFPKGSDASVCCSWAESRSAAGCISWQTAGRSGLHRDGLAASQSMHVCLQLFLCWLENSAMYDWVEETWLWMKSLAWELAGMVCGRAAYSIFSLMVCQKLH